MALDERSFFSDRNETRPAKYACPKCRRTNEYAIRWVRRVKKDRIPPGADERDRAKFAKLRDHLIRVDDEVVCKTCGRKFEIPSLHSLLFVDQLEGLPQDVEDDVDAPPAAAASAQAPAAARPAGQGRPERQDRPRADQPSQQGRPSHHDRQDRQPQTDRQPQQDRQTPDRAGQDRSRGPRRMTTPSRGWR